MKEQAIFDCFLFLYFIYTSFYGAKTASVWCLNVRQLSEMFNLVISLLEVFCESPDNQPIGLHNNVRFFFYRFGGICSRPSSFDSAAWVSSTSWISATSESGNPSGILGCFLMSSHRLTNRRRNVCWPLLHPAAI